MKMQWITRLNAAVHYIEDCLTAEIDYEKLGKIACCSSYHFQRMFSYMASVPLSEYIRRRKMSRAATDLQSGQEKIIDIAQKYGYDSPTAFNRAFQSVFGFAPSQAKESGRLLKSFPPISFQITIKGATQMDYRIEKKEAFRVVGISTPLQPNIEENFALVPKLWAQAAQDGTIPRLAQMINGAPAGILGVSVCNDASAQWRYFIAAASTLPEGDLETYIVPAATWAVFSGDGDSISVQGLEQRIVTEWLPTSGYEYGNAPDIEVYLNQDPQNMQYEVWIPVVKKAD